MSAESYLLKPDDAVTISSSFRGHSESTAHKVVIHSWRLLAYSMSLETNEVGSFWRSFLEPSMKWHVLHV